MSQGHAIPITFYYTIRVDDNVNGYLYAGWAEPGTLEADTKWQVRRLDVDGNLLYAQGSDNFEFAWTDRLLLTYT